MIEKFVSGYTNNVVRNKISQVLLVERTKVIKSILKFIDFSLKCIAHIQRCHDLVYMI